PALPLRDALPIYLPRRIEQDGVRQLELPLGVLVALRAFSLAARSVRVDGHPHHALLLLALRQIHQAALGVRRLHERAVGVEPLEHHRLAAVLGQLERLSVQVGQAEVRRGLAELRWLPLPGDGSPWFGWRRRRGGRLRYRRLLGDRRRRVTGVLRLAAGAGDSQRG